MPRGTVLALNVEPAVHEALVAEGADLELAVTTASTVSHAWSTLDGIAVALVVVDLSSAADLSAGGLDLIAALKRRLGPFAPPVIALTDRDDEELFAKAFEAGAVDVIARPIAPALLRVKVRRFARVVVERPRFGCVGPYEIVQELGRGGMGVVYLALRDGVKVAVKVLDVGHGVTTEDLVRFRREADALRALEAPNVPRFIDAGRTRNTFWVAMEYVAGTSVSELLKQGPFGQLEAIHLIEDVAAALEGVHAAGLVHRDVKPANVIVTPDGTAKLVDFGLAKGTTGDSLTAPQDLIGTAVYMAPEVLNDGRLSAAADAYALGITALEALLGKCPIQGSVCEVATRILRGHVPSAAKLLPATIDPLLVATIDGLLDPDPRSRTTARAAREVLATIARTVPTSTETPASTEAPTNAAA